MIACIHAGAKRVRRDDSTLQAVPENWCFPQCRIRARLPVSSARGLGAIRIGDRCFLGDSVIVLPGVSIGDDCIIGAGSVVSRDVPAGSIAAGNPARVLKSTAEYAEQHRRLRASGRTFGDGYHVPGITEARRTEVLQALEAGPVYID